MENVKQKNMEIIKSWIIIDFGYFTKPFCHLVLDEEGRYFKSQEEKEYIEIDFSYAERLIEYTKKYFANKEIERLKKIRIKQIEDETN